MIIKLSNSDINRLAAQALNYDNSRQVYCLRENFSIESPTDSVLTILDLDANGVVQNYLAPSKLVEMLIEKIGKSDIKTIQLLISDIVPGRTMLGFATELSQEIQLRYPESDISIQVPHAFGDCLLIQPPVSPQGLWTGYSLPSYKIEELDIPKEPGRFEQGNFEFYRSKMTTIAFQGSIIDQLQKIANEIFPSEKTQFSDFKL